MKKVREVITPGGEFAQGKEITKNYLCTENRISSFQEAKKQAHLPGLKLVMSGETRVSFSVTLCKQQWPIMLPLYFSTSKAMTQSLKNFGEGKG